MEKRQKVTKFTVERELWYRGGSDPSLRRHDGSMCCLGFLALACGLRKNEITEIGSFTELGEILESPFHDDVIDALPDRLLAVDDGETILRDGMLTDRIIKVNDEEGELLPGEDRERRLTELFREAGVEVEFVGEGYPEALRRMDVDPDPNEGKEETP